MRIVATSQFYIPQRFAGSETAQHAALLALRDAGHDVEVLCANGGGYEVNGLTITECTEVLMLDELARRKPDVVIGQHTGWWAAAVYGKKAGIPSIYYTHNDSASTSLNLCKSPTLVVHNTETLVNTYSRRRLPYTVLHPPVFADQHRTTPGMKVTLVNLRRQKGSPLFYRCASSLQDIEFLGVEGGYGVQEFQHWDNVTFQPQTLDMRTDVWSKTRILLMPSDLESYGMVGVEAIASGIPVIASAGVPGIEEALGDAAFYIDREDPQLWVNKIKELQDGRRWAAASRRAQRRSAQIEQARPGELARWVAVVELAHEAGREGFKEAWYGRSDSH